MDEGNGFCQSCGERSSAAEKSAAPSGTAPASVAKESVAMASSNVMTTNVASALAYLAGFITGIVFLVLEPYKSNSVVRFHAFQSVFFNVAWLGSWIVWTILSTVLTPLKAGLFGFIALPLMLIFTLAGFGIWIFLMYQAYRQELFRLPIVGKFAARQAGVRV
jgi:uncharacterized membrane protein